MSCPFPSAFDIDCAIIESLSLGRHVIMVLMKDTENVSWIRRAHDSSLLYCRYNNLFFLGLRLWWRSLVVVNEWINLTGSVDKCPQIIESICWLIPNIRSSDSAARFANSYQALLTRNKSFYQSDDSELRKIPYIKYEGINVFRAYLGWKIFNWDQAISLINANQAGVSDWCMKIGIDQY